MKDTKVWNIIEKLFDNFPFRVLISAALGGIVFAITPNNAELITKFGKGWFVVFISLISFLILSFIVWVYNVIIKFVSKNKQDIKDNEQKQQEYENWLEGQRKQLFNITNQWNANDINMLKQFILNNNEPYKIDGCNISYGGIFGSSFVERKEDVVPIKHPQGTKITLSTPMTNVYTLYWLKEDVFKIVKLIYDKYGKLSKFDSTKGEDLSDR